MSGITEFALGAEVSTYRARFFQLIGSTPLQPKLIQHQYNWAQVAVLSAALIGSRRGNGIDCPLSAISVGWKLCEFW
jgi:hypothetical protein